MSVSKGNNNGKIVVGIAIALFVIFAAWALTDTNASITNSDDYARPVSATAYLKYEVPVNGKGAIITEIKEPEYWSYSEQEDKLRSKTSYWASSNSIEIVDMEFPYTEVQQSIILRNRPSDGFQIMLSLSKGQYDCAFDGCVVNVKFDNQPIVKYSVNRGQGSSDVLFIKNKTKFKNMLMKSKQVMIESSYFNHGPNTFTFNVSGLKWNH